MTSTERHYFLSEAWQVKKSDFFDEARRGMVLIRFQLYKLHGSGWIYGDDYEYDDLPIARNVSYEDSAVWTESHIWISLSSLKHLQQRKKNTQHFAELLEEWRVPKPVQPAIIEKLFQVVDLTSALERPIIVAVRRLTLRLRIFGSHGHEATELNPTAESSTFIEEDLYQVSLDGLGTTTEQKTFSSCGLCMEGFYNSDSGVQKLTRLPCSHTYHEHCIVKWPSEITRSCPLCKNWNAKFDECREFWIGMLEKHACPALSALIFCLSIKHTLQPPPHPDPPKSSMSMMGDGNQIGKANKEYEVKWYQTVQ